MIYIIALLATFLSVYGHIPITKYVIPCGGWGTRMLPFTKAFPKEITQLMNKPAIQVIVEEGVHAGLTQFYIITKRQKSAIEDHFDAAPELEQLLAQQKKIHLLHDITMLRKTAQFLYIRQAEQGGTGHAVATLKHTITDDYFMVGFPDLIIIGEDDMVKTMVEISQREQASVVAIEEVPMNEVNNYGVVVVQHEIASGIYEITDFIEKPDPKTSPSNLVNIGRYVLSKKIFASLDAIARAPNGELQLPDAIKHMLYQGERVLAYKIKGKVYDIGRPGPWLEGTIRYGLQHPDFKEEVTAIIRRIMQDIS